MYSGVARSSYRQHSCDDVTILGLCDWFTNELTDWRRRRKEITYETLGYHLVQKQSRAENGVTITAVVTGDQLSGDHW